MKHVILETGSGFPREFIPPFDLPNAGDLARRVDEGAVALEYDPRPRTEHVLGGYTFWPQGMGAVLPPVPGIAVRMIHYVSLSAPMVLQWAALVRFAEEPNGSLGLVPDSFPGTAAASLEAQPRRRLEGMRRRADGTVLVTGKTRTVVGASRLAGLGLCGEARGGRVLWAAVSQSG